MILQFLIIICCTVTASFSKVTSSRSGPGKATRPVTTPISQPASTTATTSATTVNELAFPRRSCVCDIGIINHVMIMPIHEKSRPLKNCAVAVEYCKQICAPAVARQILGFRDIATLQDVPLTIKPFWESRRSLGDALCQSLGRETSKPLELAVYAQAKSCGRRGQAANGTFTERLCCLEETDSAMLRSIACPTPPPTIPPPTERVEPPTTTARRTTTTVGKKKTTRTPASTARRKTTSSKRSTTAAATTTATVTFSSGTDEKMPEPMELRERTVDQFKRFMRMLRGY